MTEPTEYSKPDGVMAEAGISNNFYLVHVGREANPNDPEDKGVKATYAEMQVTLRWPNLWDSDSFDHFVGLYLSKKAMKGWRVKTKEPAYTPQNTPASASSDAERAVASGKGNPYPVPPAPPTSAPVGQGFASAPSESVCAMIEVTRSFKGGKPQLKFYCSGIENPLTYTKDPGDMAKLVAPLGLTPAHLVEGQRYNVSAVVVWQQNDKYKNVLSVRPNG